MNIDPKKIARMITEDPNEIAPSDHFDDTEDEYIDDENSCAWCGTPGAEFDIGLVDGVYCQSCKDYLDSEEHLGPRPPSMAMRTRTIGRSGLPRLRDANHEY